ncbi:hypothetical protein SDC9_105408 [bioreactor metagenome]|uniref:Uncharacterized protein n=1 Tax=bioreactor metagenome TaxID=1076179 RepID=A0A645AZI1_9ZZZZ
MQAFKNLQGLVSRRKLCAPRLSDSDKAREKARADVRMQAHLHVVQHAHVAEQSQVLKGAPQAHARDAVGRHAHDVVPRKADAAAIRRHDARENVQQRSLACTIRADQRMHMAGTNLDVHLIGGHHAAIGLEQTLVLQQHAAVRFTRRWLQLPCGKRVRQHLFGHQPRRKLAREQPHEPSQPIGHGIQRKQQQRAVGEMLHIGPARKQ